MKEDKLAQFKEERKKSNEIVMKYSKDKIKKFYSIDTQVYQKGALPKKTKELLGLVASFALRCDDCITYHLMQCYENGITNEELEETLAIGLIIGGSITIPHLRKVFKAWNELKNSGHNQ